MRSSRLLLVAALSSLMVTPFACSDDAGNNSMIQCDDGRDNDGNGLKDYPEDPSCTSEFDETEDGVPTPLCANEKDDDGDGKTDFPNDPGCYASQQDSEEDDCPDGPGCPQCANGIDDDGNGATDFPSDGGCDKAADIEEYTSNANACGSGIVFKKIPFTGMVDDGMLMAGAPSRLQASCGGTGTEDIYEIRVLVPKVIVATTDTDGSTADTVLSLRSANCTDAMSELACNDNVDTADKQSTLTASISTPGTYFLIVDSKDAVGGAYELKVNYYIGEGTSCVAPDECGPGLVCRIPKGGAQKICTKHICEDGLDEDGDGLNDYPQDPGCTALTDDDETDGCPGVGPNCPECGDGVDNDGDTKIDYGNNGDDTCTSASSSTESCVSTEGVDPLITASTMGTTVGQTNDVTLPSGTGGCQSSTSTAPDRTYRLDLPAMTSLTIANTMSFDGSVALLPSSCIGAPLLCEDEPEDLEFGALNAGTYYYVVDGWGTGNGTYTINVSGLIAPGAACTSPLAMAGAINCGLGYSCQSGTCQPAVCFDGVNQTNGDNDTVADFPDDPGCSSPADNDEANPAMAPTCKDGMDNDGDTLTDYPADFGCTAASGSTEEFCAVETDAEAKITTKTTTGTTTGKTNNHTPNCPTQSSHTASDVAFALNLPVPVATLNIDTDGTTFDSMLIFKSLDCTTQLDCDDQGGNTTNNAAITMTGLNPGGYAIIVDGWLALNGAFTLNVQGTVAPQTRCDSPLFTGGANAVLLCPAGTTCKPGSPPRCQP